MRSRGEPVNRSSNKSHVLIQIVLYILVSNCSTRLVLQEHCLQFALDAAIVFYDFMTFHKSKICFSHDIIQCIGVGFQILEM